MSHGQEYQSADKAEWQQIRHSLSVANLSTCPDHAEFAYQMIRFPLQKTYQTLINTYLITLLAYLNSRSDASRITADELLKSCPTAAFASAKSIFSM